LNPVYLFRLTAAHADWAATRQVMIAGNIANANTPGYLSMDVKPFQDVMSETGMVMARTTAGHISPDAEARIAGGRVTGSDVISSGNPVSLDQELVKSDEVNRAFSLDNNIARAFNRMVMATLRSGS
jgi:flagellar basal-body rod protein FlgB